MALDMNSEGEDAAAEKPDSDAVLWTVASCSEGRIAAVELALPNDQAAATYLYRVEGRWEVFARLIDRALDATGFQRRMILLSDDALNEPEHLAEAMLVRRTPALLLLRRCFVGRAIHSSYERWLREIKVHDPGKEDKAKESMERVQTFCESCGKKFPLNGNFCMNCGVQR